MNANLATATERLAQSRDRIRLALREAGRDSPAAPDTPGSSHGGHAPGPTWLDMLAAIPAAGPIVGALRAWCWGLHCSEAY